jgi:hypothetical protein
MLTLTITLTKKTHRLVERSGTGSSGTGSENTTFLKKAFNTNTD